MLQASGIRFAYPGAELLFDDLALEVEAGQMVAITGRSGRGKSTLLYMLGLMVRPQAGDVIVAGTSTRGLGDTARARLRALRYGFVFQDAALDATRSVLANVTEPAIYRGDDPRDWTERAVDLLQRLGVDVPVHRAPGQVSGGQAQRIALCRALLAEPDLVLADEPTGNLDASTSATVLTTLRAQAQRGAAVVVFTHDEQARAACDLELAL